MTSTFGAGTKLDGFERPRNIEVGLGQDEKEHGRREAVVVFFTMAAA